jgi:molecular chaperone DnaK
VVPQRIVALGGGILPSKTPVPPAVSPLEDVLDLPKPGPPPIVPSLPSLPEISLPRNAPQLTFDKPGPASQRQEPFAHFFVPQGSEPPPAAAPSPPSPKLDRPLSAAEAFAASPIAAAIAAAPPAPRMAAPLLIDVTPLSLRVETVAGYCDVLIAANTAVPCDRTRTFLTAADGQATVIIRVAQGESNRFAENTYLGELELTGLTPAPRGETQIAVTFEIDADGILNVKAKDVKSNRQTQARLQLLGAQTDPKDVEEMMKRQAQHAVV